MKNPIFHLGWFTLGWWKYLFEKLGDRGYCKWYTRLWCRIQGHPEGPWYYNPGGFEPDMHCKNCGDEIG